MRAILTRLGGMLSCVMLTGCGTGDREPCRLQTLADLPLVAQTALPAVGASLDGRPVILLIDSGASESFLSRSAARRLGLRPAADARFIVTQGVGGMILAPLVKVHGLRLGRALAADLQLPVMPMLIESLQGVPVLGLFGADFLSNYDVDIDLPAHRFGLYRTTGCSADLPPFDPPYFEVPFSAGGRRSNAVVVEARLNDRPISIELDTGSTQTVILPGDAAAAGVVAQGLVADEATPVVGVDAHRLIARRHAFASLEIGDERLTRFRFLVAPMHTNRSLLGNDFLRFNRVLISYWRHALFIQPAMNDPVVHQVAAPSRER